MRQTLKVISIVGIILGALAIASAIGDSDVAAAFGGIMFVAWGWLTLAYFGQEDKKEIKQ